MKAEWPIFLMDTSLTRDQTDTALLSDLMARDLFITNFWLAGKLSYRNTVKSTAFH